MVSLFCKKGVSYVEAHLKIFHTEMMTYFSKCKNCILVKDQWTVKTLLPKFVLVVCGASVRSCSLNSLIKVTVFKHRRRTRTQRSPVSELDRVRQVESRLLLFDESTRVFDTFETTNAKVAEELLLPKIHFNIPLQKKVRNKNG